MHEDELRSSFLFMCVLLLQATQRAIGKREKIKGSSMHERVSVPPSMFKLIPLSLT